MPNDFAQRVKAYRTTNNLTQAELAKRLELSTTAVKSWEHGYRKPSEATRVKLDSLFEASTAPKENKNNKTPKTTEVKSSPKKSLTENTPKKKAAPKVVAPVETKRATLIVPNGSQKAEKISKISSALPARAQEMITAADGFFEWFHSKNIDLSAANLIELVKAAVGSSR
ncbi:helix-turn-helix domain-containing protein [Kozakia baliensis]|uniref:Uncharacterized protein n=1 Tax=Kozakia baliensis TaxID=153496 RepID=A0A1D8UU90_9PROT|nr:helix-turn-helix transcriptional regulator [Kozakia baliensis]AOX17213.1 hypothetical protein A0U89_08750 [Kozakia baliensis]GBR32249.1 hypothetical protein AA0488_2483 [Kozakia baliensis NRIC 0488]GEL64547.1 hypothetical protein KBA01_18330 [Kozakia baliensis]